MALTGAPLSAAFPWRGTGLGRGFSIRFKKPANPAVIKGWFLAALPLLGTGHISEGFTVLHTIEMRESGAFDFLPNGSKNKRLERVQIECGQVLECKVRCRVHDLTEVADITLADGVLQDVPCRAFHFLDRAA
jgi:hypothetical protein